RMSAEVELVLGDQLQGLQSDAAEALIVLAENTDFIGRDCDRCASHEGEFTAETSFVARALWLANLSSEPRVTSHKSHYCFFSRRSWPVISFGWSMPRAPSTVGEMSWRAPSVRRLKRFASSAT